MTPGPRRGIDLRAAVPADAADLARLLGRLGHAVDARGAAERLDALARDPAAAVLVAADYGPVVGLLAMRWGAELLHARPVARITLLVVDEAERGRGIGRLLLKAGAQAARLAGCDLLELAAVPYGGPGESFCRALGFERTVAGYARSLRKKPRGG